MTTRRKIAPKKTTVREQIALAWVSTIKTINLNTILLAIIGIIGTVVTLMFNTKTDKVVTKQETQAVADSSWKQSNREFRIKILAKCDSLIVQNAKILKKLNQH